MINKKIVYIVGGLGSQMSAYALWISLRNKFEDVEYDLSWFDENPQCHQGSELPKIFGIPDRRSSRWITYPLSQRLSRIPARLLFKVLKFIRIVKWLSAERCEYDYDPTVFSDRYGVTVYYQCWTSYKYFIGVEDQIKAAFSFPPISSDFNEKFQRFKANRDIVSIHVRCGDSITSPAFAGLTPIEYFREATDLISAKLKSPIFLVFTDDLNWCRKNLHDHRLMFAKEIFPEIVESYQDMQVMSMCDHNIISSSSFSWWAAFLNSNPLKIVIAPEKWIRPDYGKINNIRLTEMVMPGWITIKNI
jgi:hypothetical protein